MKKNNKLTGIIILAVVILLAVIIIIGTNLLTKKDKDSDSDVNENNSIELTDYPNSGDIRIQSASKILTDDGSIDGYLITVASKGYGGDIIMDVTFDKTGDIVNSLAISDQNESEGYGDKITEEAFLSQFNGISAPVSLSGKIAETSEAGETATAENTASDESDGSVWADGTYVAETDEFDEQGYKDKVTITIQDSKITEVIWDAYNESGQLKSVLSADGAYVMTDDGPTWQEQAVAIADFVIQNQSADGIVMNEDGQTDTVAGVSISVKEFINLIKDCLAKAVQAAGEVTEAPAQSTPAPDKTEDTPGQIDGVSGATVSSTAVVDGINKAQSFIKDFVLTK